MSDKMIGDLRAQVAANHVGARRVQELMRDRGLQSLDAVSQDILFLTEQRTRRAIAEVPDGTYTSRFELEDADPTGNPLEIRVAIGVQGDEMTIDYAGTSPQVDLPINCVENFTRAHTMFAVKCLLGLDLPFNSGCFAPIRISAPEGSILNALFPAACMWRTDVAMCLPEVVFEALGAALPERVMAPSGSYPLWLTILAGQTDSGEPFVAHFNASGGQGAMATRDGHSTTVFPGTITNTPVEMMETEAPVVFERKALRPDSGRRWYPPRRLGPRRDYSQPRPCSDCGDGRWRPLPERPQRVRGRVQWRAGRNLCQRRTSVPAGPSDPPRIW